MLIRRRIGIALTALLTLTGWVVYHSIDAPTYNDYGLEKDVHTTSPEEIAQTRERFQALGDARDAFYRKHPKARERNFYPWSEKPLSESDQKALQDIAPLRNAFFNLAALPRFAFAIPEEPWVHAGKHYMLKNSSDIESAAEWLFLTPWANQSSTGYVTPIKNYLKIIKNLENANIVDLYSFSSNTYQKIQIASFLNQAASLMTPHEAITIARLLQENNQHDHLERVFAGQLQFYKRYYQELALSPTAQYRHYLYRKKAVAGPEYEIPRWDAISPFLFSPLLRYNTHPNRILSELARRGHHNQQLASLPCNQLTGVNPVSSEAPWPGTSGWLIPYRWEKPSPPYPENQPYARKTVHWVRRCKRRTQVEATAAILALHAYKKQRGTLPDTLEALVPDYLKRLPRDFVTGGTLHLNRKQRWLYGGSEDPSFKGSYETAFAIDMFNNRYPSGLTFPMDAKCLRALQQTRLKGHRIDPPPGYRFTPCRLEKIKAK